MRNTSPHIDTGGNTIPDTNRHTHSHAHGSHYAHSHSDEHVGTNAVAYGHTHSHAHDNTDAGLRAGVRADTDEHTHTHSHAGHPDRNPAGPNPDTKYPGADASPNHAAKIGSPITRKVLTICRDVILGNLPGAFLARMFSTPPCVFPTPDRW